MVTALTGPLAWELPYATGAALKRQNTHTQNTSKQKALASDLEYVPTRASGACNGKAEEGSLILLGNELSKDFLKLWGKPFSIS